MSDNHPQLQPANSGSNSIAYFGKIPSANGEIQHIAFLADDIGNLYMSEECNDIILKVNDCAIPAHRVILAARSEYFRALLYNGMRESSDAEIELAETPLNAFKLLLKYIYTGKLSISPLSEEAVLEILGLAHKYGFSELETSISEYLKAVLNVRNVCTIYESANLYSLRSLCEVCLNFADKHAPEIISTQGFLQLSVNAIEQMIQRDSLCAPEIDIFKAVREWVSQNPEQVGGAQTIISKLRLSLIKLDDLLNIVRPSRLVSSDAILDAIKVQLEKRSGELQYRGFLMPNVNVMTASFNAVMLNDDGTSTLFSGDTNLYDTERSFTTHAFDEKNPGITIQLGRPFIINHIRLLLWDRDQRSYSYYIEVSIDKEDWVRVIDRTHMLCRSKQMLYFPPRVASYIRVVGTYNTVNNLFSVISIEAMYTSEQFEVDPISTMLIPTCNVATIANNATVIEGVSRSRNALINGETDNYDWDNGYTCHQLGSGAIVVQLPQPYLIDSMRLLLWDCDDRHYSFYVEVSCDNNNWVRVADKTQEQCKAWQLLKFERRPVVFIRIVGTHNSANEVFHCVHFECPAQRAALSLLQSHSRTQLPTGQQAISSLAGDNTDDNAMDSDAT